MLEKCRSRLLLWALAASELQSSSNMLPLRLPPRRCLLSSKSSHQLCHVVSSSSSPTSRKRGSLRRLADRPCGFPRRLACVNLFSLLSSCSSRQLFLTNHPHFIVLSHHCHHLSAWSAMTSETRRQTRRSLSIFSVDTIRSFSRAGPHQGKSIPFRLTFNPTTNVNSNDSCSSGCYSMSIEPVVL